MYQVYKKHFQIPDTRTSIFHIFLKILQTLCSFNRVCKTMNVLRKQMRQKLYVATCEEVLVGDIITQSTDILPWNATRSCDIQQPSSFSSFVPWDLTSCTQYQVTQVYFARCKITNSGDPFKEPKTVFMWTIYYKVRETQSFTSKKRVLSKERMVHVSAFEIHPISHKMAAYFQRSRYNDHPIHGVA